MRWQFKVDAEGKVTSKERQESGALPGATESAKKTYGERFAAMQRKMTASGNLRALCPEYEFWRVALKRMEPERKNPPVNDISEVPVFAFTGKDGCSIASYEDAARFISSLQKAVPSETEAQNRASAFIELVGGTLMESMPKAESIIEMYKKQDPADWPTTVTPLKSGYQVRVTALVNPDLHYCIRFTLDIEAAHFSGLGLHHSRTKPSK